MASKEDSQASIRCIMVLMRTFNTHLMNLQGETVKQKRAIKKAIDCMAKFEFNCLEKLKKEFKVKTEGV